MKAVLCKELGPPSKLVLEEIETPKPKANEVLIQVKACSVNFPDSLIIQGLYQFKPDLPFSPGSDMAGIVLELGEGVSNLKVGDEVIGFALCGGFAEKAIINANACYPKLPGLSFPEAASFMYANGTSYHALKDRARLKAGETLLVLGASGGVGLAAVQLGKAMGAKVIACASTDEKLALCKEKGADELINYTTEDLKKRAKELTDGKGVDVIYDPVGGDYAEQAIRAMAWKGRYLVIGFAAGTIPKIPLNLALLKGCSIVGVFWGSFATREPGKNFQNVMEIAQMMREGKISTYIDKIYSLENAADAIAAIIQRKVKGKVVVSME